MIYKIDEKYLVEVRRYLHAHPELSLNEIETSLYIEEQLDAFGIAHQRIGPTGVLGRIVGKRGEGKTVLLRADIDALPITEKNDVTYRSQNPGIMHACGHDAHTAALLGAARVLQSLRYEFSGRVLLIFQPAEEFGQGSRFFEGVTGSPDRAFAVHVNPQLTVGHVGICQGTAAAACDFFRVNIQGKSSHITLPNKGIDALYIGALLAVELKSLTNRVIDPFETVLIGLGKLEAGVAYNVIADTAVMEGSVRSFSDETQFLLKKEIMAAAEKIAALHGGSATVEFESFSPALVNKEDSVHEFVDIAAAVVGHSGVLISSEVGLGLAADDFAVFLKEAKGGVYAIIGSANREDANVKQQLHSNKFDIDEGALAVAAKMYIAYTLSILLGDASALPALLREE